MKVLFHEMSTKKIGYLELVFDADFADLSELPYLSLLKQILGVVAAGEYSYTELMDEVNIHTVALIQALLCCSQRQEDQLCVSLSA